jgi:hypothetical protein
MAIASSSTGKSSSGINGSDNVFNTGGPKSSTTGNSNTATSKSSSGSSSSSKNTLPEKKIEEKRSNLLIGQNAPIVFPSDLSPDYYISFNAFKHSQERPDESKRTFKFDKSIYLPLPGGIADSYSASYNQEDLYIFGNAAKEGMNALMTSGGTTSIANAMKGDGINKAAGAVNSALAKIKQDPTGSAKTAGATAAAFMLQGAGGPMAAAAKSAFQVTTNPFPVMIFQGTGFKPAFSFDWTFYPESQLEADIIRKVVGYFRREMLPEMVEGNPSILKSPAIFEVKMTPNEYTRQFKRCVLTNMSVNYTPNGVAFIKSNDGTGDPAKVPAAVSLSLTFQEIEVWLADDYHADESKSFGVVNKPPTPTAQPTQPTNTPQPTQQVTI